ncbi:MAG: diaminopropionate ammonia-lyase [Bacillota bacterium]|nr:diaminopropionate ammonia-lyase [Bacillota bacterium]
MGDIRIVHYDRKTGGGLYSVKAYGESSAAKAREFHNSFPEYEPTPLVELKNLASDMGIKNMYVKDESYRFGLNAFKVLGGSYAIGSYIAQALDMDISDLPYERLVSDEIKGRIEDKFGKLTFITATDGNHGRGVAWTAARLEADCVVYMPKGSALERLENIRNLGARASITDMNYDDAVRLANDEAETNGWIMVQDTAWEGYEDIPAWIMQGYATIGSEITEQLGDVKPTHVFLQAGVGAFSGAVCGFMADYYGDGERPVITIVEPWEADCMYRTAEAADGMLHPVTGDMDSIMAGLCCGEPCTIGWNVLRDHADNFLSVPDYLAADGMRVLGNPLGSDSRIVSGESGAVTSGVVFEIMKNKEYANLRDILGLDENSVVLCISTEGDTDRENYRNIVWKGAYSR